MTIHVTPMPHVLTNAKDTNANVTTDTLVMDTNAAMLINAKPVNTTARVTQCVSINATDTSVSANQVTVVITAATRTNVTRIMVTVVTMPSVSTSATDTSASVLRDTLAITHTITPWLLRTFRLCPTRGPCHSTRHPSRPSCRASPYCPSPQHQVRRVQETSCTVSCGGGV